MDGAINREYAAGLMSRQHYGGLVSSTTSRDTDCLQSLRSGTISLDNDMYDPEFLFVAGRRHICRDLVRISEEGHCAIRQNKIVIAQLHPECFFL